MKLIWCTLEFCYRHFIVMYRYTYPCTTKNLYNLCDCLWLTARKTVPSKFILNDLCTCIQCILQSLKKKTNLPQLFIWPSTAERSVQLQQELFVFRTCWLFIFYFKITCHQVSNSFKAYLLACFFCCTDDSHINFELNLLNDIKFREKYHRYMKRWYWIGFDTLRAMLKMYMKSLAIQNIKYFLLIFRTSFFYIPANT